MMAMSALAVSSTPFISATYPSAVPKSVRSVTIGRIYTDVRDQRPVRQRATIAMPRAAAVAEIVHQIPEVPHCAAAHAASGIREAVRADEVSIGGRVDPPTHLATPRAIVQAGAA